MAQLSGPLLVQPDPRTRRRMDYADLLMKQGADTSPAPNWLAAAARALTGAVGGYQRNLLDSQHEARQTRANEGIAKALEAGKGWQNPDMPGSEAAGQAAADYAAQAGANHDGREYLAPGQRVGGGYEAMIAALEGQQNPDLAPFALQLRTGQIDRQQKSADELAKETRQGAREEARDRGRWAHEDRRDERRWGREDSRDAAKADREPPKVETFYDDEGREQKKVWNRQTKSWEAAGGSKAPAPRLVKVLDENGDAIWAPVSDAAGHKTTTTGRGGGPTLSQDRENASIDDARRRIAAMKLSPEALRRKLEYGMDPVLEGLVKQAGRRKYGEDPGFEDARNFVFGKPKGAPADTTKLSDEELLKSLGLK